MLCRRLGVASRRRACLLARLPAGEWAEAQAHCEEAPRAATPSSSSDGYSQPSSSCPEEVSWPPAAAGGAPRGSDCYAAINLMTMSATQTAAAHAAASCGAAPAAAAHPCPAPAACPASPASAALHFDAEQFNHDSLVALAARYGAGAGAPPHHRVAPVTLSDLSRCLPPAKVLELVRLNQELEVAVHEAHAASAAVAAVAQVLACKQAAALRSRDVAGAATKRLRRFMAELDTQVGAGVGWRG